MGKKKQPPQISTNLSTIQTTLQNQAPPNIIHHRGDLNEVIINGKKVYRQEFIAMDLGQGLQRVRCTPYDDHFVFRDPTVTHEKPGWTTFCTCGSAAGVINFDAYKLAGSNEGAMLACLHYTAVLEKTGKGKHLPVNYNSVNMANG